MSHSGEVFVLFYEDKILLK